MAEGKMTSERDIDYALELRALAHDVSKWDAEICEAAAQEIERLRAALELYAEPGNWMTENGLYLYSGEVDPASLVWEWSPEVPVTPWEVARKALKGETNEGNTK